MNARIGGGSGLNRFCGVNLPLLAVRLFKGRSIRKPVASGQAAVSRSLQFYVHTEPFDRVVWKLGSLTRSDGKVNPRAVACLFDLRNRGVRQFLLHPAGMKARSLLEEAGIPCFFEEILPYEGKEGERGWVAGLRLLCGDPSRRCVCVTDGTDPTAQEIHEQIPELLLATPDTLEMLGWERVS